MLRSMDGGFSRVQERGSNVRFAMSLFRRLQLLRFGGVDIRLRYSQSIEFDALQLFGGHLGSNVCEMPLSLLLSGCGPAALSHSWLLIAFFSLVRAVNECRRGSDSG